MPKGVPQTVLGKVRGLNLSMALPLQLMQLQAAGRSPTQPTALFLVQLCWHGPSFLYPAHGSSSCYCISTVPASSLHVSMVHQLNRHVTGSRVPHERNSRQYTLWSFACINSSFALLTAVSFCLTVAASSFWCPLSLCHPGLACLQHFCGPTLHNHHNHNCCHCNT